MTTINDLAINRNQGIDEQGRKFGYIHTGDAADGGYFFTWLPTLDETVGSIDADTTDKPTFDAQLAGLFLRAKIADKFEG